VAERKKFLLRIDPQVHDALQRWANDELRSLNAHIEYLLRRTLDQAGRPVRDASPPRRGRPPKAADQQTGQESGQQSGQQSGREGSPDQHRASGPAGE
jgi:hypothetical protein